MKINHFVLLFCLILSNITFANDFTGITEQEFIDESLNDTILKNNFISSIREIDTNKDNIISTKEFKYFIDNEILSSNIDANNKNAIGKDIINGFIFADKNNDKNLSDSEIDVFSQKVFPISLRLRFLIKDKNHDGILDHNDFALLGNNATTIEKTLQNIHDSLIELESMDNPEMYKNWIDQVNKVNAESEFQIIDENKDNCISIEEYATYNYKENNKLNQDNKEDYTITKGDYANLYVLENKKNPHCITKDEYVNNFLENLNETKEKTITKEEFANKLFITMDENDDGRLTADEFSSYRELSENQQLTKDLYKDMFFASYPEAKRGWINNEEFKQVYLKE